MSSAEKMDSLIRVAMAEIEKDLIANNFLPKVGPSIIVLNDGQTAFELKQGATVSDGYSQKFLAFLNHLAPQLAKAKAQLTICGRERISLFDKL